MEKGTGVTHILLLGLSRRIPSLVAFAGVIAFLFSEFLSLEIVIVLHRDVEQFFYFFSSAVIQGIVGIAAFTVAAVTLFPPSHPNQHPKDPEEFEWWTRSSLTELATLSLVIVIVALVLPFVGTLLHNKQFHLFSNWIIIATILLFSDIVYRAMRLIRRTVGYSREHFRNN